MLQKKSNLSPKIARREDGGGKTGNLLHFMALKEGYGDMIRLD